MPTLKNITCCVEWSSSNQPLQEYQTTFADGYVESYIAVPSTPSPFSIHLRSNGYIAPGLAMFVYMDGVYQCNRNRYNLVEPGAKTRRRQTEVDFRVRQKEERLSDGMFRGKQWRFEKVNIVPGSSANGSGRTPHDGEYVGSIEVVVLRCFGEGAIKPRRHLSPPTDTRDAKDEEIPVLMGGLFDGTSDCKKRPFGLDGAADSPPPPRRTRKTGPSNERAAHVTSHYVPGMHSDSQYGRGSSSVSSMSSGTRDPATRHATLDHYRRDWDSVGYHSRAQHPVSPISSQPDSPFLHLRGGAPGSYSVSPAHSAAGWGVPLQNQPYQPTAKDWAPPAPPPVNRWDPAAQDAMRNAWGELEGEPHVDGTAAAAPSWDVPAQTAPSIESGDGASGWDNPPQDSNQDWSQNATAGDTNGWDNNDNNNDNNNDWNAGDGNNQNDTNGNGWDNSGDTNNNDQWQTNGEWGGENGDDSTSHEPANQANEPPLAEQKTKSPMLTFGNSIASGFKAANAGKARSTASSSSSKAAKPLGMKWVTTPGNKTAKGSPKFQTTSMPGEWSPPLPSAAKTTAEQSKAPQRSPILSMPNAPKSKSYWTTWKESSGRPNLEDPLTERLKVISSEDEPVYAIPAPIATQNRTSHQVRPMHAAVYTHKLSTPKYMDTHADPYAIFVFKYRDRSIIEGMIKGAVPDPAATAETTKSELLGMSKADLVEELVRAKEMLSAIGSSESDKVSFKSHNAVQEQQQPWGPSDLDAVNKKLESLGKAGGVGAWAQNSPAAVSRAGSTTSAIRDAAQWGASPKGGGAWTTNQTGGGSGSAGGNKNSRSVRGASDWGDNGNQGGGSGGGSWDNNNDQGNGHGSGGNGDWGNGDWGNGQGNGNDTNNNGSGNDGWGQNGDDQGNDNGGWENNNDNGNGNADSSWDNNNDNNNGASGGNGDDWNGNNNGNGQNGDAGWDNNNADGGSGGGGNNHSNNDWGNHNNADNDGGDTTWGATADNGGGGGGGGW